MAASALKRPEGRRYQKLAGAPSVAFFCLPGNHRGVRPFPWCSTLCRSDGAAITWEKLMQRQDRSPRGNGTAELNPGDEAPAGTAGTGEAICPECHGSGRSGAAECPNCGGTGRIIEGVGGG